MVGGITTFWYSAQDVYKQECAVLFSARQKPFQQKGKGVRECVNAATGAERKDG